MRPDPTSLDSIVQHGIDVRSRRVWLHGEINEESARVVVRGLFLLGDFNSAPISFLISSPGGDVDHAFEIYDAMRLVRAPIHTTAFGHCGSAAPFLLAAGKPGTRRATVDCEFMYHGTTGSADGSIKNMRAYADAIEARSRRMDRLLVEFTNMDGHHWSRINRSNSDRFFTAKEALEWGLIDEIL